MTTAKRLHYSYEEYLRLLEESTFKLEYCDGVIYAMAGGTVTHAALGAAVIRAVGARLSAGCTVYSSDLKVRIASTDLATFPDASVVCGPPITAPEDRNAITNPVLLVEVTSRSTEDYDRGDKLSHYKQLASVQAVLFVSHRSVRVTVVERRDGGWIEREHRGGEQVRIAHPTMELPVDELYAGVTLEPT
ncbi:Uma2 family endonuclease [Myxococcota bacterium]|nr:Uma2 family endonuclease [Myxococcota bacterium]